MTVTEGPGFIARHHVPAGDDLLPDPFQQVRRLESLRRFGTAAIFLQRDDVPRQVRVDRDLQQWFELRVIYRLPVGHRRSRKNAFMHVGRYCGTLGRPVSAFMFS